MFAQFDLVLLYGIIFVMTVKPEFGDSALLQGLLAAVLAGGLIFRRYRVALSQPPPGPASGEPAADTPIEPA
jgi:hypothetical protein